VNATVDLHSSGVSRVDYNRETTNSAWKVVVSFKIIMMMSLTRPCFIITQH